MYARGSRNRPNSHTQACGQIIRSLDRKFFICRLYYSKSPRTWCVRGLCVKSAKGSKRPKVLGLRGRDPANRKKAVDRSPVITPPVEAEVPLRIIPVQVRHVAATANQRD